jgi:hypothetical protein
MKMDLYGLFFIIQFLAAIAIIGAMMFNVMSMGKIFDIRYTWLLFSLYFIVWLIGFVIFAGEPEETLYQMLFKLESWLIVMNTLFLIIQQFYYIKEVAQANMSRRNSKIVYSSMNK